jgi:hypothetical protein
MGEVDLYDKLSQQNKKTTKKHHSKHFHHFIDICGLNYYLLKKTGCNIELMDNFISKHHKTEENY